MFKSKKFPIVILSITILIFFGWTELYKEQEWRSDVGSTIIQMLAGAIGFIWLLQAYLRPNSTQKNFWLLLSIALLCSSISDFIWLYSHISSELHTMPVSFLFFWGLSAFFFLAAFVYKAMKTPFLFSNKVDLFNTIIYLITAFTISYYYLTKLILINSNISMFAAAYTIGYQVVALSTLFIVISLYHFLQSKQEKNTMLLLAASILLHLAADFLFIYLSVTNNYRTGTIIDLLWIVALLLIGFTGLYSREKIIEEDKVTANPLKQKVSFFPYASILILIALVSHSNLWNYDALSIGLLLTIFMVLGLQVFVIHRNNALMDKLGELAYNDPLTGLANRLAFTEDLTKFLQHRNDKPFALLLIDLNRFKAVNDAFDHHIGDRILTETAERLKNFEDEKTQLYRLEGVEFVLILTDASELHAALMAESILESFQKSFQNLAYEITLSLSIGISLYPEHGTFSEELLKNADAAMYRSKKRGVNAYSFYSTELQNQLARKLALEKHIQTAIADNQLSLVYQPKVDLQNGTMIGMEALLRWNHPDLGWISPVEFIPLAEETGQIIAIGEWVLQTACTQNKRWQEQGFPAVSVSVNVSVLQFQNGKFLKTVENALSESRLEAAFLELEITESIMQNIQESIEVLEQLKKMGVQTSIDDFGTGYSSLHVLQKLPIDILKVDKSFIDEVGKQGPYTMVKAIIELGLNLNLIIVAEGIETSEQLLFLQESGCSIGQGYLFSKPVHAADFEALLKNGITWKGPARKGA